MTSLTWKQFIELIPYYIQGSKNAECKGCQQIHPNYKFSPKQLYFMQAPMYLLWCENCGTRIHIPTERKMNCKHDGKIKFIKKYKVEKIYTVDNATSTIDRDGNFDYFMKQPNSLDAECLSCGTLFAGYKNFPEIVKNLYELI